MNKEEDQNRSKDCVEENAGMLDRCSPVSGERESREGDVGAPTVGRRRFASIAFRYISFASVGLLFQSKNTHAGTTCSCSGQDNNCYTYNPNNCSGFATNHCTEFRTQNSCYSSYTNHCGGAQANKCYKSGTRNNCRGYGSGENKCGSAEFGKGSNVCATQSHNVCDDGNDNTCYQEDSNSCSGTGTINGCYDGSDNTCYLSSNTCGPGAIFGCGNGSTNTNI